MPLCRAKQVAFQFLTALHLVAKLVTTDSSKQLLITETFDLKTDNRLFYSVTQPFHNECLLGVEII